MALDPSIILNAGRPTVQLENPLNALTQASQLAASQSQNALLQSKLQDNERAYQDQQDVNAMLRTGADGDALIRAGHQTQGVALNKSRADAAESKAKADKDNSDTFAKNVTGVNLALNTILPDGSNLGAVKAYVTKNYGAQYATPIPDAAAPDWQSQVQALRSHAIDRKTEIEQKQAADTAAEIQRFHIQSSSDTQRGQNISAATAAADRGLRSTEVTMVPTTDGGVAAAPKYGRGVNGELPALTLTDKNGNPLKGAGGAGGKAPLGYRYTDGGDLEVIPGGPADKIGETQVKQIAGAKNLQSAIQEYRTALDGFGKLDVLSPTARADMGTKYNNMMLQAKEAYNLGVLNGGDERILRTVINDPMSKEGLLTPKSALDKQATELDRIMSGIANNNASVSQQRQRPTNQPATVKLPNPPARQTQDFTGWSATPVNR